MNWNATVRDVMSERPVSVGVDDPPSVVQEVLNTSPFHHLPVVDGGVLVGIVSTTDLARVSLGAWVEHEGTQKAWLDASFSMSQLMTAEPEWIQAGDPLKLAADKLSTGDFHALPVVNDDRELVGMLTSTDLLRWLVKA